MVFAFIEINQGHSTETELDPIRGVGRVRSSILSVVVVELSDGLVPSVGDGL